MGDSDDESIASLWANLVADDLPTTGQMATAETSDKCLDCNQGGHDIALGVLTPKA